MWDILSPSCRLLHTMMIPHVAFNQMMQKGKTGFDKTINKCHDCNPGQYHNLKFDLPFYSEFIQGLGDQMLDRSAHSCSCPTLITHAFVATTANITTSSDLYVDSTQVTIDGAESPKYYQLHQRSVSCFEPTHH